jgi:hypothetical protein
VAGQRADPLPHRPDDELDRKARAAGSADEGSPARDEGVGAGRLNLVDLQLPCDLSQVARLLQLDRFQLGLADLQGVRPQPVDHLAADIEQRGHRIQCWDGPLRLHKVGRTPAQAASKTKYRASASNSSARTASQNRSR